MARKAFALLSICFAVVWFAACGVSTVVVPGNSSNNTPTSSGTPNTSPTNTPPPSPDGLGGVWVNDDVNTNGVTKLVITTSGQTVTVHGFGRCHPTYCDWGSRSGTFSGSPFTIHFDFGGGLTHDETLSLNGSELQDSDNSSAGGTHTYQLHRLSAADYVGTWINDNASTNDVPKVVITGSGSALTVHGYGACSPDYCDWNTRNVTISGDPVTVLFDFGGGLTHTLTIGLDGPELTIVDVGSHSGTINGYFHQLSAADYAGTWYNDDASTRDVPQVVISGSGNSLTVHGYGACSPSYCDWGTRTVTITGDPVTVLFDFGGGLTHTLVISLDGPKLQITDIGSASGTSKMYFHH